MMKEEQILLAGIKDKISQCSEQYRVTHSAFLDLHQRDVVERFCVSQRNLRYLFYGGYEDAERTIVLFLPDYIPMDNERGIGSYFKENQGENPLILLRVSHASYRKLTHRDYLGSLLGLGIKREKIGDILVREDGCDIIMFHDIANFLLLHYEKAANVCLKTELCNIDQLIVPIGSHKEVKDTVASLRLDCLVASAFSLSRTKAAEMVEKGIVSVNGVQQYKPEMLIKEGDKLVLRGKGKARLKKVGGETRKDRIFILLERYQ